jgi:iron only hydrogenase large subunit-like protein
LKKLNVELKKEAEREEQETKNIVDAILKYSEMKELWKLCNFTFKKEVPVTFKVNCDFSFNPFAFGADAGKIDVQVKEPPKHILFPFVDDPYSVGSWDDNIWKISPEIDNQFKELMKFKKAFVENVQMIFSISKDRAEEVISLAYNAMWHGNR